MVEFLSEGEIDKLLSQVNDNGEIAELEGRHHDIPTGPEPIDLDKVHKKKLSRVQKFSYAYKSPVIKSEDVEYNPPKGAAKRLNKIPVYSLPQYRIAQ